MSNATRRGSTRLAEGRGAWRALVTIRSTLVASVLIAGGAAAFTRVHDDKRLACLATLERWSTRAAREGSRSSQLDPLALSFDPSLEEVAHPDDLPCVVEAGRQLFESRFTKADGAGRPGATGDSKPTIRLPENDPGFLRTSGMDANSCAGCHNQPAVGGSGDFVANVFVGAQFRDPPTRSLDVAETSERNTVSAFGAGAIELLAREMTAAMWKTRDSALAVAMATSRDVRVPLETKGVLFGALTARPDGSYDGTEVQGVDVDLVVKPFGVKGVVISLREFTINALNHHHGMEATERFGWERTGRRDFDLDGVRDEFSSGQVTALTMFQASLPAPVVETAPKKSKESVARGRRRFEQVGCAGCHRPSLPLDTAIFVEPNPYNRPGNLVPADVPTALVRFALAVGGRNSGVFRGSDGGVHVAAFTDLKRHRICDAEDRHFCNEVLRQDNVPTDQFLTSKLWDAGTSAPYGHRGDCVTLEEAIQHHSGEARVSRRAFDRLLVSEKRDIIGFLRSLRASPTSAAP